MKCSLLGGEPTVYPRLFEVIEQGKALGLFMALVTNGRKLADKKYAEELKKVDVSHVSISIQGASSDSHNSLTKNGQAFDETISGIKNCVDLGIPVSTATVVGVNDADEYKKLLRVLKDAGAQDMPFNSCLPALRVEEDNQSLLTPKASAAIIEEIYVYGKEQGVQIGTLFRLPLCLLSDDVAQEMINNNLIQNGCQVYSGRALVINPDGSVLPCSHWMDYAVMDVWKDKQKTKMVSAREFMKRWNSGVPFKLREEIWRYRSKKCIGCSYWAKHCFAGCPLLWSQFDPEEVIPGLH